MDVWVAGLDEATEEAAIGEAALAERRRQARLAEQEAEEVEKRKKSPTELKTELLSIMHPKETISATLRRLSGKAGRQIGKLPQQ